MKSRKRVLALLLAAMLSMPTLPVLAAEADVSGNEIAVNASEETSDEVSFNMGNHVYSVVGTGGGENGAEDAHFAEDGSYTIEIPEMDPFFPYEVQFTCNGESFSEWFMTPYDSVEVGGHTFYVNASFSGDVITQMKLNVAGNMVTVYPEEKEFTDDGDVSDASEQPDLGDNTEPAELTDEYLSLLHLVRKSLKVDLTGYTPVELTEVGFAEIFTGVETTDASKLAWTVYGDDDYRISGLGDSVNLSYSTYSSTGKSLEVILGDGDQLNEDAIRYTINIKTTASRYWLSPSVYKQTSVNNIIARTEVPLSTASDYISYYYDYDEENRRQSIYVSSGYLDDVDEAYVSLKPDTDLFGGTKYANLSAYEGNYSSAAEAVKANDITSQLFCSDMTQNNAGYPIEKYKDYWVTLVAFDENGKEIGCLPLRLYLREAPTGISFYSLRTEKGYSIYDTRERVYDDELGCYGFTYTLYSEYPADGTYYQEMDYCVNGVSTPSAVTAAYAGYYKTIKEAKEAGAADIKAELFGDVGYGADYSNGVYFTVFVGEDGSEDQKVWHWGPVRTVTGTTSKNSDSGPNSGTAVTFTGLKDKDGKYVDCYVLNGNARDTYTNSYNYKTIFVGQEVDLTQLAPTFHTESGVTLYAAGASQPEVSGVSLHDFSNGAVQYIPSSEDKENQENYWLEIVKAEEGVGKIYINSFADADSDTRVENGVTYSEREVMLDSYRGKQHDILVANIGTEAIEKLSVELISDSVQLDEYWTFKGVYELDGMNSVESGEMSNLAKIHLSAKDGVADGTEVSGTLKIKSGDTTLAELTLTGLVGNPVITISEVPEAVKYVPYGTMLYNSNKYSWNKVSYEITDGELPEGMELKSNGELYGVPKQTGEFTFTVEMSNSYSSFPPSSKELTLTVVDNTDANVDAATDEGYDITTRIAESIDEASGTYLLVSQGIHDEFVDLYLDGEKLADNVDYTHESGSTRITIQAQTLAGAGDGTHTLGVEFRTKDTDTLKRAAQNYRYDDGDDDDDEDSNSNDNSSGSISSASSASGAGSANGGSSSNGAGSRSGNYLSGAQAAGSVSDSEYVVQSGDTLWKIAVKFYGNGSYWQKIYADNSSTISNPDMIRVGQVLVIKAVISDGTAITASGTSGDSSSYTVEAGDSLWKIAKNVYGNGWQWRKIYNANADKISDPENIYEGQVIVIP